MTTRAKRESTTAGLLTPDESFEARSPHVPTQEFRTSLRSLDGYQEPRLSTEYNHTYHGLPEEHFSHHKRSPSVSPNLQNQSHNLHDPQSSTMSAQASPENGLRILVQDVNRLIALIEKLRRIGMEDINQGLPELVLVGDQSGGKSSLMGAIAEIQLPKQAAMCTRCPYNIRTTPAPEWECTISLQQTYVYEPAVRRQSPKWHPSGGLSADVFKTITNKLELEEALTWAQIALLNPSKDKNYFVPGGPDFRNDSRIEAEYSPNVVNVAISGPGLPSLSFFDLPGLFQHAGKKEQDFLVKAFDDLTIKYLKHENAIIICTIPMGNDAALSKTQKLIREVKAEGRCIGVLTMPDRMQGHPSTHTDYDEIFRGTAYVLPRPYFVTKQPGPGSQLDRSLANYHALAREEEEKFFDESHWGVDGYWAEFRDRCGTSAIQSYLSKEFARQILASLPDLTEKIASQTREVDEALAALPETPNDKVQHVVRKQLIDFSTEVRDILKGSSGSFHADWDRLCSQFLKALELMRPGCICTHPSDKIKEVIQIDDSDTESVVVAMPHRSHVNGSSGGLRRQREEETPSGRENKRLRVVNDTPISPIQFGTPANRSTRIKQENGFMSPSVIASPSVRRLRDFEIGPFRKPYLDSGLKALTISGIREMIEKHGRAGFPDYVSHEVKEKFALQAINFWVSPLMTFLDHTFAMLRAQIFGALRTTLQQYLDTDLYKRADTLIDHFLTEQEAIQRATSMEFYKQEECCLFTLNSESFERYRLEALDILKRTRHEQRLQCYADAHFRPKSTDADKNREDREKFKKSITPEQLGRDAFERELEVAAFIRGYYTIARFRFIDTVCGNVNTKYFRTIAREITGFLEDKFDLNSGDGEAKCLMLVERNAEATRRRAQLRIRKAQLLEFAKTLDELKNDTFAEENGVSYEIEMDDASSSHTVLSPEVLRGRHNHG